MTRTLSRVTTIAAAAALVSAALAVPTAAVAADATPSIKGHVTTYGGHGIKGIVVEVKSSDGTTVVDKSDVTTSTGRYSIPVDAGTYAISFVDDDGDETANDAAFVSKSGHVTVANTDVRIDKELHHVAGLPVTTLKGHVSTYGGKPIAGILVEVSYGKGNTHGDKSVKTSKTGRYSLTLKGEGVYTVKYVDDDGDEDANDADFVAKTGHIRVTDQSTIRIDKKLHHVD
jgi:hypothetical protein